jgi:hypothetical protein
MVEVFTLLYAEGGIMRFYKGAGMALFSSPIARFGDTAANEGVKEFFSSKTSPVIVSWVAAVAAALWRIAITPLTTIKTTLYASIACPHRLSCPFMPAVARCSLPPP